MTSSGVEPTPQPRDSLGRPWGLDTETRVGGVLWAARPYTLLLASHEVQAGLRYVLWAADWPHLTHLIEQQHAIESGLWSTQPYMALATGGHT
ncbi:hypothetical protein [Salinactinospora qingdaonensis]|uniref:Uncharacterized protein n=1 Tax=Salinactinospora qingdaonensis TaxID=702744 RepID=A0ABP7FJ48_9ACTN